MALRTFRYRWGGSSMPTLANEVVGGRRPGQYGDDVYVTAINKNLARNDIGPRGGVRVFSDADLRLATGNTFDALREAGDLYRYLLGEHIGRPGWGTVDEAHRADNVVEAAHAVARHALGQVERDFDLNSINQYRVGDLFTILAVKAAWLFVAKVVLPLAKGTEYTILEVGLYPTHVWSL